MVRDEISGVCLARKLFLGFLREERKIGQKGENRAKGRESLPARSSSSACNVEQKRDKRERERERNNTVTVILSDHRGSV